MSIARFAAGGTIALLLIGASVYSSFSRATPTDPRTSHIAPTAVARLSGQDVIDPERVVGRESCAKCHDRELEAWAESAHAKAAYSKLETGTAEKFGEELGIDDVTTDAMCLSCHGTRRVDDGGAMVIEKGNSCESCHGAAGGDDGWFEIHGDYGHPYEDMDDLIAQRLENKETPDHRRERFTKCFQAGMNTSNDVMAIVKNCLQCHAVPIAELVEIGHPTSEKFEFVEWAQGEVRHNFLLDRDTNAESPSGWLALRKGSTAENRKRLMFVVGQLADLEFSLRTRARIDDENDLLDLTVERVENAVDELDDINEAMEDDDNLEDEEQEMFSDLFEEMEDIVDDIEDIEDGDNEKYTDAANRVAEVAFEFVKAFPDGSRIPEDIEAPDKAKGDVYEP